MTTTRQTHEDPRVSEIVRELGALLGYTNTQELRAAFEGLDALDIAVRLTRMLCRAQQEQEL